MAPSRNSNNHIKNIEKNYFEPEGYQPIRSPSRKRKQFSDIDKMDEQASKKSSAAPRKTQDEQLNVANNDLNDRNEFMERKLENSRYGDGENRFKTRMESDDEDESQIDATSIGHGGDGSSGSYSNETSDGSDGSDGEFSGDSDIEEIVHRPKRARTESGRTGNQSTAMLPGQHQQQPHPYQHRNHAIPPHHRANNMYYYQGAANYPQSQDYPYHPGGLSRSRSHPVALDGHMGRSRHAIPPPHSYYGRPPAPTHPSYARPPSPSAPDKVAQNETVVIICSDPERPYLVRLPSESANSLQEFIPVLSLDEVLEDNGESLRDGCSLLKSLINASGTFRNKINSRTVKRSSSRQKLTATKGRVSPANPERHNNTHSSSPNKTRNNGSTDFSEHAESKSTKSQQDHPASRPTSAMATSLPPGAYPPTSGVAFPRRSYPDATTNGMNPANNHSHDARTGSATDSGYSSYHGNHAYPPNGYSSGSSYSSNGSIVLPGYYHPNPHFGPPLHDYNASQRPPPYGYPYAHTSLPAPPPAGLPSAQHPYPSHVPQNLSNGVPPAPSNTRRTGRAASRGNKSRGTSRQGSVDVSGRRGSLESHNSQVSEESSDSELSNGSGSEYRITIGDDGEKRFMCARKHCGKTFLKL